MGGSAEEVVSLGGETCEGV